MGTKTVLFVGDKRDDRKTAQVGMSFIKGRTKELIKVHAEAQQPCKYSLMCQ